MPLGEPVPVLLSCGALEMLLGALVHLLTLQCREKNAAAHILHTS